MSARAERADVQRDPDRLAQLEEERRFLLRSIDDLEREHDAGDVDDHDFAALRDGYVARAAAVLREIDEGRAALPPRRRRPGRALAIVVVTLVVAAFVGWFVARSSGQREASATGAVLPADEVTQQLSLARNALSAGDFATAFTAFQRVRELDASNVEAATYLGWVAVLSGRQSGRSDLVDLGVAQLRQAITIDSTYTDAHCLLGVALVRLRGGARSRRGSGRAERLPGQRPAAGGARARRAGARRGRGEHSADGLIRRRAAASTWPT